MFGVKFEERLSSSSYDFHKLIEQLQYKNSQKVKWSWRDFCRWAQNMSLKALGLVSLLLVLQHREMLQETWRQSVLTLGLDPASGHLLSLTSLAISQYTLVCWFFCFGIFLKSLKTYYWTLCCNIYYTTIYKHILSKIQSKFYELLSADYM